ncbi:hypothetical protein ACFPPD_05575 [Cohnella suwonensis]|uniref:Uncharacterized protein n=1 Tax=Cohnella suwonensis TaxID=696072 RepID=A0ABW0LR31_9BACL
MADQNHTPEAAGQEPEEARADNAEKIKLEDLSQKASEKEMEKVTGGTRHKPSFS